MIPITCHGCGKQLKIKDELAGKKVRCPQCKAVLEVPAPFSEDATVPPSQAPGEDAADSATIPPSASHQESPDFVHAEDTPLRDDSGISDAITEDLAGATRYQVAGEIARGGMGAIKRAVDQDICREVAVKFLLNHADDRQKARFFEEAQITGQLEHPNIVPIHQLGTHRDGRCFFSMKMVKGRSLADILNEPGSEYPLGRLLNIMIAICNALAYAHSRQVIHRDLKPANVMVGDFGEVYVMDWGLAKVLGRKEILPAASTQIRRKKGRDDTGTPQARSTSPAGLGDSQEKVTTRGRSKDEMTQAGAVMGTPSYMPPEQAKGELQDVDERSDIYALGAILYEIMTLTPPVGRGGDVVAILMRVVNGEIDPPEQRAPERAKQGWIPPELAAIAIKALAKKPKHRYQTVEKLKRDIELFVEGRTVSAKQDTAWEMFKKLIKRNREASIATAAALVVIIGVVGFFLKINNDARVVAETANANFVAEQEARRVQGKKSAPSFLADSQHSLVKKDIDHALAQVDVALDYDPGLTEAWLLKGQLLIGQKKFDSAAKYLSTYLERQPGDAEAKKLLDLCGRPNLDDVAVLIDFSETLSRQKAFVLAEIMVEHAGDVKGLSQRLFKLYQQRLNAAWPGAGDKLQINPDTGKMSLLLDEFRDLVADLTPLQGMKLESVHFSHCRRVADLSPLKGMPLTDLWLDDCQVNDLSALKGMRLTLLNLYGCLKVTDLSPLQGVPLQTLALNHSKVSNLSPLKGAPLTHLDLTGCNEIDDLTPLEGMKLTTLLLQGCSKVRSLAPLRGMKLLRLEMSGCREIKELTPLEGMPLTYLDLNDCPQISDLRPLRGMKLNFLRLDRCPTVADLSPLQGMPLQTLALNNSKVSDLSPLKGMPLTHLDMTGCNEIDDLTPLDGMKLTTLLLQGCSKVRSLAPLRGMKLPSLQLNGCRAIKDLAPLAGIPLTVLSLSDCPGVTDLSPLQGMKLEAIVLPPQVSKGLDVLRTMSSLRIIDNRPAAQFWQEHDAKKAGK